jgi:hypothetical protein
MLIVGGKGEEPMSEHYCHNCYKWVSVPTSTNCCPNCGKYIAAVENKKNGDQTNKVNSTTSTGQMSTYRCNKCNKEFEEIGIPPQIQMLRMYKSVVNIGSEEVTEEVKNDPFLYRAMYCPFCNKAFCPPCCNMQSQICPECGKSGLMPGYRPLLNKIKINKNCFIATAVYGDLYHPSVRILRNYRDTTLSKSILGRLFIHLYYIISPHFIGFIKCNQWIEKNIKNILDKIVNAIASKW